MRTFPIIKQGYDRKLATSPSAKVWHWAQDAPTCMAMGEAGMMPAYATRCGKEIIKEIADREIKIRPSMVECSVCMANRLYTERTLIERARKEIRAPKTLSETFDSLGELLMSWFLRSDIGQLDYLNIEAGKNWRSGSDEWPSAPLTEYALRLRYYTPEQMQMFADEKEALST